MIAIVACAKQPAPLANRVEQGPPERGLEVKIAYDGSAMMAMWGSYGTAHAHRDIRSGADEWDAFGKHYEPFLIGPSRQALERFVAETVARFPVYAIPPNRELAYQRLLGGRWRTHYLGKDVEIRNAWVDRVLKTTEHGRPVVVVELLTDGRRALTSLTRINLGRRLVILVDGVVVSSQVIQRMTTDGRIAITFDGSHEDQLASAAAMVARFRR